MTGEGLDPTQFEQELRELEARRQLLAAVALHVREARALPEPPPEQEQWKRRRCPDDSGLREIVDAVASSKEPVTARQLHDLLISAGWRLDFEGSVNVVKRWASSCVDRGWLRRMSRGRFGAPSHVEEVLTTAEDSDDDNYIVYSARSRIAG